ncbi:hypothetical protein HC248_00917 [Polaromonas vacuolata]|uniref:DUF1232 domain-containing protein n=1 Tax=Polaromonas vacuolata TaxID=37448 RepID=A0A6H2H6Z8_9BURK|nr:DUF1232 domain-containing protein [Polaromonas vacuolata]QJC55635.1 hypothetical protein HC248_00917 [Polaromonas vacuolata]
MNFLNQLKLWAKKIKRDGLTLWFALKNPDTPWFAKALAALVVAYALSPIDLIPDFIPVLGYLDDVILLPLLIWLTIKMLPATVLCSCREKADEWIASKAAKPKSTLGAVLVIALWMALSYGLWRWYSQ